MSFTIDVHHHVLPDVFWRATNDAHGPVGGILPAPWLKESMGLGHREQPKISEVGEP